MLKDRYFRPVYHTPKDNSLLMDELFVPALQESVMFDRISAYFTADSLDLYARGLEYFAKRGQKYRLVISTDISEEDYEQIKQGYVLRDEMTEEMARELRDSIDFKRHETSLSNLAYLIGLGVVEIKMAFVRQGTFHYKIGLFKDEEGNILHFHGSANETHSAYQLNCEQISIDESWSGSASEMYRIEEEIELFDQLWNDRYEYACVKDMPEVIRREILKFDKGHLVVPDIVDIESFEGIYLDLEENRLTATVKLDPDTIRLRTFIKVYIKSYGAELVEDKISFFTDLTYMDFKDIISKFERNAAEKGYVFRASNRLMNYIENAELEIVRRSRLGLDIKRRDPNIQKHYDEYKSVVDAELARPLLERQMWDSFFLYTMRKAANFSVPGAGKTATVLGVFAFLRRKKNCRRLIVVGPLSSFESWKHEFAVTFGCEPKVFTLRDFGSDRYRKKQALKLDSGQADLLLFNYEVLDTYADEIGSLADDRTLLVFDEVHKVKAVNGQRAGASLRVSRYSNQTIILTGTPLPNSYKDLYVLLNILFPNEYRQFFSFDPRMLDHPSALDMSRINEKILPFYCRTTKQQLGVPPANEDINIDLTPSEAEQRLFQIISARYRHDAFSLLVRLLQLESDPKMLREKLDKDELTEILDGYDDPNAEIDIFDYSQDIDILVDQIPISTKRKQCIETVKGLVSEGKSVIIWCIFKKSMSGLEGQLNDIGIDAHVISGGTPADQRTEMLDDFRQGKFKVLITNPHTLGESVSLHGVCHDAIYYEYSYNLVHLLQSKDRIHRLGLPEGQYTQYYYLRDIFMKNDGEDWSLDRNIYERLGEKERRMLDAIEREILDRTYADDEDVETVMKGLF